MVTRQKLLVLLLAALFLIGGVVGGGPTSVKFSMLVELVACILGTVALAGALDGETPREATPALVLLALILIVPIAQIIPIPAAWSASLSGRAVPNAIRHLIGDDSAFYPMSLDPEQTRLAILALLVPAATFLATLQLTAASRDLLFRVIVGFALLSALVGILQVTGGGGVSLGIYNQTHEGFPIGFFANRNHEADLLLVAIPLSARLVLLRPWSQRAQAMVLLGLGAFFAMSVVATQSRTGMALLPVAVIGALIIWRGNIRDRMSWLGAGAIAILSLLALATLNFTPVGRQAFHRFASSGDDLRPHIWDATWVAIKNFWPAGSGAGTFPPVYNMFEDLNWVSEAWVNHAHNDYLELLLVAGLPAAILMAAYFVIAGAALWRRVSFPLRGQRYAAATGILIFAAHSLTDYPLRTFGLLTLFAFFSALLYPSRDTRNRHGFGRRGYAQAKLSTGFDNG